MNAGPGMPPHTLPQTAPVGIFSPPHASLLDTSLAIPRQTQLADGVIVVPEGKSVTIRIPSGGGFLLDVDDTMLQSNEIVYESAETGCYSKALQLLCAAKRIPYSPEDWKRLKLSECLGRGLGGDCKALSEKLQLPRNVSDERNAGLGLNIEPTALKKLVLYVQRSRLPEYTQSVPTIPHIESFLLQLCELNIPRAVCSAAPVHMALGLLRGKGLFDFFNAHVAGATKKTAAGGFVKDAAFRACSKLRVDPQKTVMVGDSISDVATAALAGVRAAVIRIGPSAEQQDRISKLIATIGERLAPDRDGLGVSTGSTNVIVVSTYQQSRIVRTAEDRLSFCMDLD